MESSISYALSQFADYGAPNIAQKQFLNALDNAIVRPVLPVHGKEPAARTKKPLRLARDIVDPSSSHKDDFNLHRDHPLFLRGSNRLHCPGVLPSSMSRGPSTGLCPMGVHKESAALNNSRATRRKK